MSNQPPLEQAFGFWTEPNGIRVRYTFDVMPNDDMRLVEQEIWVEERNDWVADP